MVIPAAVFRKTVCEDTNHPAYNAVLVLSETVAMIDCSSEISQSKKRPFADVFLKMCS